MLNMQTFHKKLVSPSTRKQDSYLNALTAITRINPDQLNILASDLDWEQWAPSATEPTKI